MPSAESTPRTLYDKVFQAHIVDEKLDGTILLYIDRHLVHEVTSPVSFVAPKPEKSLGAAQCRESSGFAASPGN